MNGYLIAGGHKTQRKELMKKLIVPILIVLTLLLCASCATFATNEEVPQSTIPILGFVSGGKVPQGEVIASYSKFIGICIGYSAFVEAVDGEDYDVVEKTYFLFNKVYAVSK